MRSRSRDALHLAGYANTAAGRRPHTDHDRALTLYRIE